MRFLFVGFSLFVFPLVLIFPSLSGAAGFVSEKARFIHDAGYIEVSAGQYQVISLPGNVDKFEVRIDVLNKNFDDMDAFVCDDQGLNEFRSGQRFRCYGVQRGKGRFSFQAPGRGNGGNYLLLNNKFSLMLTKKINYEVIVTDTLPPEMRENFNGIMTQISEMIQRSFEVPEFDLSIKPCGRVNAFSHSETGDITVCSELFIQEIRKKRKGALAGIIYHEIGHSLLSLWNIPGNANEELVDEFAVVMMHLTGEQGVTYQLVEYFAEVDAVKEAMSKIYADSRHPLSPQRVRNIKRILDNPKPVIERWNQILYPRMTVEGLQNLLMTNPMFADRALAEKTINLKRAGSASPPSQSRNWGPPPQVVKP